jgi:hypothetical protein
VLANDFIRDIALESLGPGVPADYVAIRVQHVDREVPDGGDQQFEALQLDEAMVVLGRETGHVAWMDGALCQEM